MTMRVFSVVTWVTFIASLFASIPIRASAQETKEGFLTIPLQLERIEAARTAETGLASFRGAPQRGIGGQPALPCLSIQVLLPPDADVRTLRGSLTNAVIKTLSGSWQVDPMPPEFSPGKGVAWPESARISEGKDLRIYGNDEFFPKCHLQQVAGAKFSRWLLAEVIVRPFRYNPVTGTLQQLKTGDLLLTYQRVRLSVRTAEGQRGVDSHFRGVLRNTVVNFESIVGEYERSSKRP